MLNKTYQANSQGPFHNASQASVSFLNRTPNKIVLPTTVTSHSVNLHDEPQSSARQRVLKQSKSTNEKTFLTRDLSSNALKLVPGSSQSRSKPQIPKQGSNSGGHVSQRTTNNCSTRESEVSQYLLKRKSEQSKDQIYTSRERMTAQIKADNQNMFQELKEKERLLYTQSQKLKAYKTEFDKLWKIYGQILPSIKVKVLFPLLTYSRERTALNPVL